MALGTKDTEYLLELLVNALLERDNKFEQMTLSLWYTDVFEVHGISERYDEIVAAGEEDE